MVQKTEAVLDERIASLRLLTSGEERGSCGTDGDRRAFPWGEHNDVLHPSPRFPRDHEILLGEACSFNQLLQRLSMRLRI